MDVDDLVHGRFDRVDWIPVTGSTNADLMAEAADAPTAARVLFADEQTAGRGRRERRWSMVAGGGILVSFYVPWAHVSEAHVIPTALGVAAISAIESVGRTAYLKWPNDIVADDDRKIGGMLSEALSVESRFVGVVAGLGCNVHWPPPDTPMNSELSNAVSLDALGSGTIERQELAAALVAAFAVELDRVQRLGVGALHDRYRQRCSTLGRTVRVDRGAHGTLTGVATDVSPDGALLVSLDGVQHRIDVGDVVHLRPAAG